MKVSITINSENRIVVIPMEYFSEEDTLGFGEIQVEPTPNKDEDISKDIVMNLTYAIITMLENASK